MYMSPRAEIVPNSVRLPVNVIRRLKKPERTPLTARLIELRENNKVANLSAFDGSDDCEEFPTNNNPNQIILETETQTNQLNTIANIQT
jgi:hypothetical protein